MRFKPGPLTEASAVSAIGWFTSFLLFFALYQDLGVAVSTAFNMAVIGYMPAFSFWGIAGFFTRAKSNTFRFVLNVGLSLFVALAGSAMLLVAIHSATGFSAIEIEQAVLNIVMIEGAFFLTALLGAVFTYTWFIDKNPSATVK